MSTSFILTGVKKTANRGCLIALLTSVAITAPIALPKWGCLDIKAARSSWHCWVTISGCNCLVFKSIGVAFDVIGLHCQAEGFAESLSTDGKD